MARLFRFCSFMLIGSLVGVLAACSTPTEQIAKEAEGYEFFDLVVEGNGFTHQVYRNRQPAYSRESVMHVYLEGDGSPWIKPDLIAVDPTSRSPLMLKLMARDSASSLYLGRPCYHGYFSSPPCHPNLWAGGRYSETVVASMAEVLEKIIAAEQIKSLTFFGYSGGGTLAVLLAERFTETLAVVTIAGNLDIDIWADMHNYTLLDDSLNPASRVVLGSKVHQLHLVGGRDTNVKEHVVAAFASNQKNAELVVIDDFDHRCCWVTIWTQVLAWTAVIESSQGRSKRSFQPSR